MIDTSLMPGSSPVRSCTERIFIDVTGELQGNGAPNIAHSGHFVLLDKQAHLRGYYDSDDWGRIETLMRHARWLAHRSP